MHIGLFGGTFNPIHFGHLIIAESLLNQTLIDRIIFIPAAIPPHKQDQTICSENHRFKMIQLAINNSPAFDVSDYEINKGDISYSIDTVEAFQKKYPSDRLYFIIGSDSLQDMYTWHEPDRLIHMIQVVVVRRAGADTDNVDAQYIKNVLWVNTPLIEISSSQIRQYVKEKKSIRYLVPQAVEQYIYENELYFSL